MAIGIAVTNIRVGGMKSPDDRFTLDLIGLGPLKRGRGRPSKGNAALTPAQRARRYRDKRHGVFVAAFAQALASQLGL